MVSISRQLLTYKLMDTLMEQTILRDNCQWRGNSSMMADGLLVKHTKEITNTGEFFIVMPTLYVYNYMVYLLFQ